MTDPHDWIRDPAHRGEGLACRYCGITEAEAEALPRTAETCWPVATGTDQPGPWTELEP